MTGVSEGVVGITQGDDAFVHLNPANTCKHKFSGWREFEDGRGGEQVCEHCGIGAMAWTLSLDI